MRSFVFTLILSVAFLTCTKSDLVSPDTLTGTWVEVSARKDTLIFNLGRLGTPLPKTLLVNRGKEINAGGWLLPKLGSGYYDYELQDNSILVINMLSSSMQRSAYKIEQKGDQLQIENFFELGFNQPATATRTLVRLR